MQRAVNLALIRGRHQTWPHSFTEATLDGLVLILWYLGPLLSELSVFWRVSSVRELNTGSHTCKCSNTWAISPSSCFSFSLHTYGFIFTYMWQIIILKWYETPGILWGDCVFCMCFSPWILTRTLWQLRLLIHLRWKKRCIKFSSCTTAFS